MILKSYLFTDHKFGLPIWTPHIVISQTHKRQRIRDHILHILPVYQSYRHHRTEPEFLTPDRNFHNTIL